MGFRIAQMADLARQMQFTPRDKRAQQISAAEDLLLHIERNKAYPFDFVVFRVTGYHPKRTGSEAIADEGFTGQLMAGIALQHDLGLLIEEVSDGMNVAVEDAAEPVFTIEQVCEQFNVSDKSLQRWRRRGLAARRFVHPDGKRRLGFLAATVERFFALHHDGIVNTANFAPMSPPERDQIVARACRLMRAGMWADEITRRVGRRVNRASLTVSHILNEAGVLPAAPAAPDEKQRTDISTAFRRGASLGELSARYNRPRAAIYRILFEERLHRLSRWNVHFIDDPLYHQPDAARAIDDIAAAGDLTGEARPMDLRVPANLPPYLQALYKTPLLSQARERALFLKLHFRRFQFVAARHAMEGRSARWRDLDRLESHLTQAIETKNQIVAANLRLVVNVARKHAGAAATFGRGNSRLMELISDGNIALMRAVDAYDFHRGHRFCTYAMLAVMKEFARASARAAKRPVSLEMDAADFRGRSDSRRIDQRDHVRQVLSILPEREQTIVRAHFGMDDATGRPLGTREQVARRLGLTELRVQQIERLALAKLRAQNGSGDNTSD